MSKFRRILSLVMVSVMALMIVMPSTLTSASRLPQDVIGTEYEEAVELLNALEIMIGDETGDFKLQDGIKRSEVAKIAVALSGLTDVAESTKNQANFPDVLASHWANGYINVAQAQGFVIGDDTGNFRPDDQITYAEAVTIMMRVLGYEPSAQANGGFPTGYLVTAGSAGLLRGVNASTGDVASRGVVAKLAYNALTINLMEKTSFGAYESYQVVDKTLLYNKLGVERLFGQVVATGETTLSGESSLRDDQIQIKVKDEVKTYNVTDEYASDFIARNVVFYAKTEKNGDINVILISNDRNKNAEITINAQQIDDVKGTGRLELSYWKNLESDKKPTSVLIMEDATVFYNGVAKAYDVKDVANLNSGNVTLLDTDRDEVYDFVFVTEYKNMIVDEVSLVSNRITDKFNLLTLTLDPQNDKLTFAIYKDGKKIGIEDIKEWDVLSVAANTSVVADASVIKVFVSDAKVTGQITEIEDGFYKIGDKQYEVASNYKEANQADLKLGDEGTFYLDIEGKIAAVDTQTKAGSNYAYLTNAAISGSLNSVVQFEIYTKDGEIKIVDGAAKIKVNSTTNLKGEDVINAIKGEGGKVAQLITFDTNSKGEISYINTASTNSTPGSSLKNTFSLDYSSQNAKYNAAAKKLAGFNVKESTLIFEIPANAQGADEYSIRDMSMFVDKSTYDVEIYDLSEDLTAGVIIVKNSTGVVNAESSIAIVQKIAEASNEDGIIVHKLYALQDGKEIVINAKDTETLAKESGILEAGDIIQYQKNSRGEIDKIKVLFDSDDRADNSIELMTEIEGTEMSTIIGTITKKFSNTINIVANNMSEVNLDISSAHVYMYDESKTSNAKVKVVDSSYLTKYDEADAEKVFVRIYKGEVKEIVIIKEV